ncbi:hypothetical protein Xen7305DRAFT_00008530 [Xenococcus sp. PCC 7305]|uniref:hypothetical protein n=1 Tax=Xenococcus sp. PCC 7305 TaxID=102125 RepID=UPI0002ABCA1B|nr:hypothetical protein [Xenococcus sp. PCC 7305]ELS01151.1 hypothetical protein Xen7305DRAFT_00008530 [Xenococcus sp. PCC 7305]
MTFEVTFPDNSDAWAPQDSPPTSSSDLYIEAIQEYPKLKAEINKLKKLLGQGEVSSTHAIHSAIAKLEEQGTGLDYKLQPQIDKLAEALGIGTGGVSFHNPEHVIVSAIAQLKQKPQIDELQDVADQQITQIARLVGLDDQAKPAVVLDWVIKHVRDGDLSAAKAAKIQELATVLGVKQGDFESVIDTAIASLKSVEHSFDEKNRLAPVAAIAAQLGIDPNELIKTFLLRLVSGEEIDPLRKNLYCLILAISYKANLLNIPQEQGAVFEMGIDILSGEDSSPITINKVAKNLLKILPSGGS